MLRVDIRPAARLALAPWHGRLLSALCRLPTAVIIALGVCLMSPSLSTGWAADDYLHQLSSRLDPGIAGLSHRPFDLFRFADGDPTTASQLMEEGVYPWWAEPRAIFAFFRPLASATHFLDYRLWPSSPALMHLHSLAWYAALLALVGAVFRRFSSSAPVASLALLLFAIDDAHAPVVGWLANRNMVVALTFGLPALLLHDRWRKSGQARWAMLSHLSLSVGLCAGEAGSLVVTYLAAYALMLERGRWRERAVSLAGYALIVVSWRVLYNHLDYGVVGSGIYADPGREPLTFLRLAAERAPVLALGLFALPWSDLWEVYPLLNSFLQPSVLLLSAVVLTGLGFLFWPALRDRASARFWLAGCVLSILPVCAPFPHDRLLLGPSVGAMGLIAEALLQPRGLREKGKLMRGGVAALAFVHLLLAPALSLARSNGTGQLDQLLRTADASVPATSSIRSETLVLLNPPVDPFAAYFSAFRQVYGVPRPAHLYWLATGVSELKVTGLDEKTLLVRPRDGYLASSSQRMLRSTAQPFPAHQPIRLTEATFEVTELTPDGRPAEVRVTFHKGLRHPSVRWMRWVGPGYGAFEPPLPGRHVIVPAVDLRAALGL